MAKKVAIIDKAPSRVRYSDHFDFEYDHFHMSEIPITKLLKKDVTLVFDPDPYDIVILVGSEASKEYAKVTSVTNMAGHLINDKYICITNPSVLIFKPEGKTDFQRAIDKIKKFYDGTSVIKIIGDFSGINDTDEAKVYLNEVLLHADKAVAIDTETTALYVRDGYVLGVSLSYKKQQGRYIITDCMDDECISLLQLIALKYEIVFHNMKFDYKMIRYHLGVEFNRARVHDTMLMHYLLNENEAHGLKPLALKYTDYGDYDAELEEFKREYCRLHGLLLDEFTYDLIPYETISRYASIDTAVTYELFLKFWPIIQANPKLLWAYQNLMIEGCLFLMDMEEVGIPFSEERLLRAKVYLDEEILAAKKDVYEYEAVKMYQVDTGKIFNPNSVIQLRVILFDYLGLDPTGKKTGTGAISTDAEVLKELSKVHPLPAAILKVRQLTKIQNTYINKIIPALNSDKRLRTNFNISFTTSGRLSSSGKMNAQQIPRDDPIIKSCIKAPDGYKIVSQDLQTGEVYYAAVLSGDTNLQEVFKQGGDLHSSIAKMVFGLTCDAGDVKKLFPELRQAAKAITFGILYGSGAKKVAESVSKETGKPYSLAQAQDDIDTYFTRFNRLKAWLDEQKDFITQNGFTYSHFGRKRRLANVFSSDKGIASHEIRSGINALIQSVCSDVNLLGAIEAKKELDKHNLDAKIFMLVHDSIVAIVKDEDIDAYCAILKDCTQRERGCSIPGRPIGVDQEIGIDYSFGKYEKVYDVKDDKLVKLPKAA